MTLLYYYMKTDHHGKLNLIPQFFYTCLHIRKKNYAHKRDHIYMYCSLQWLLIFQTEFVNTSKCNLGQAFLVCLLLSIALRTPQSTIFQSYLWRYLVVHASGLKLSESEWDWLFNVTCNDISIIHVYVTAHRCAGGLKKKPPHLVTFYDTLGIRRTYSRLNHRVLAGTVWN